MRFLGTHLAAGLRRLPLRGRAFFAVDRVATRLDRAGRGQHASPVAVDELQAVAQHRHRGLVAVRQPLVLISQIHRSGGTLLLRLLDGHPQLHVIPHELGPLVPGRPVPLDPREAWSLLADPKLYGRLRFGLRQSKGELNRDDSLVPFLLLPSVQRKLFVRLLRTTPATSERDVLDAYLTAYFNAWLDYRGLHGDRRWIVGFEPSLVAQPARLERVRAVYPDGKLISIVREPASWWVSARRWDERYARLEQAVELWRAATRAAERAAEAWPGDVLLLDFDRLTGDTAAVTEEVSTFLGVDHVEQMQTPTVAGVAFGANSSFESTGVGVVQSREGRGALLTPAERMRIDELAGDDYRRVLALAERLR